jgi:hypothetical protein
MLKKYPLHGKIWAKNNSDGRGAIFMFSLPASEYNSYVRRWSAIKNNEKRRILLVDDEPDVTLTLKTVGE